MKPKANLQIKYKQNYKISKIQMSDTNVIFFFLHPSHTFRQTPVPTSHSTGHAAPGCARQLTLLPNLALI